MFIRCVIAQCTNSSSAENLVFCKRILPGRRSIHLFIFFVLFIKDDFSFLMAKSSPNTGLAQKSQIFRHLSAFVARLFPNWQREELVDGIENGMPIVSREAKIDEAVFNTFSRLGCKRLGNNLDVGQDEWRGSSD